MQIKLSEFAIGFCHSKKMYVTIFFVIGPMSDQNYFAQTFAKFSRTLSDVRQ